MSISASTVIQHLKNASKNHNESIRNAIARETFNMSLEEKIRYWFEKSLLVPVGRDCRFFNSESKSKSDDRGNYFDIYVDINIYLKYWGDCYDDYMD